MAKKKCGLAITTYNRSHVLEFVLPLWKRFSDAETKIVVKDDGSAEPHRERNARACDLAGVHYISTPNQGVAASKNRCIAELEGCDYLFLSDDDVFPFQHGWELVFGEAHESSHLHHLMLIYSSKGPQKASAQLNHFSGALGAFLFLTPRVLEKVGYFDERMKGWGLEHSQYSQRCHKAGLSGQFLGNCPRRAQEYLYAFDMWNPSTPEVLRDSSYVWPRKSSISEAQKQVFVKQNRRFLRNPPLHMRRPAHAQQTTPR